MKVIDKNFLKQDRKVKENLDREISILKLMERSGCDYVVKMMDALVSGVGFVTLGGFLP